MREDLNNRVPIAELFVKSYSLLIGLITPQDGRHRSKIDFGFNGRAML